MLKQLGLRIFQFIKIIRFADRKAKAMMRWVTVDSMFSTLLPRWQVNGQSGILTFKKEDKLKITHFQKHCTAGHCHN
jgi:hypothetical protein